MDINKIISIIREQAISAPTNNVGDGKIGGLPPDEPPVRNKKKKKKNIYLGKGSRKWWLQNLKDNG